jgi:hypothetical protein
MRWKNSVKFMHKRAMYFTEYMDKNVIPKPIIDLL